VGERSSIPGRGKMIFRRPDRLWGLSILMYNGYRGGRFPGDKARLERDGDHSPPSTTEVLNE
jgi:hypothetical protein